MWYNFSCLDEQNTGALCFQEPSEPIKLFTGKAPSMSRTRVLAVRLGNDGTRGGRFAMSWKTKVYKKQIRMSREEKENWEKTRRFIIDRDHYTCVRCDKHFRAKRDLSVHHIIPRSEGGTDDPTNLMTLCHPCHDFAEINGLRTSAAIIGSFDDGIIVTIELKDNGREENFTRPEWHRFVYGGARHDT